MVFWLAASAMAGNARTTGSATDALGNVYIVGTFTGDLTTNGHRVTSAGGRDVFVLKLDPQGLVLALASFGGPFDDDAESVATAAGAKVIVTGSFFGALPLGDQLLVSGTERQAFVTRLDAELRPQWGLQFGTQEAPADALGELRIVMLGGGWAHVYLDGVKLDSTAPLAHHALAPGDYEVRLENQWAGLDLRERVRIESGETLTLRAPGL